MVCRCCGHNNEGRDKGKCENCGFELSVQNLPASEKRSSLRERSDKPVPFKERQEFRTPRTKGEYGKIGALIALVGIGIAAFMISSTEPSVYNPVPPSRDTIAVDMPVELEEDTVATLIGSDIVYVFDDSATLALPRANVDMGMIPEGSTVSFVGPWSAPLRGAASYVVQKINQRDFEPLTVDRLCAWTDTTETEYVDAPLTRLETPGPDSQPVALVVKLYFTPRMLRGSVEELDIRYDVPVYSDEFSQSQLDGFVETISQRIERRFDDEERGVQVATLFDYEAYDLGDAVSILQMMEPMVVDSLGMQGFAVRVFTLTE